ncbi:MAG TPA: NAD(P)H-binding protein [Solirubrobacteraceae bacterium]|nr:NAD(P)H-binding protein [Solirubrobacteraceae bacterium]
MIVLLAGSHGRLGERILALLLRRGHKVRGLVRTEGQAAALRELGADAVVADLRGDIEWTAQGCDAAIFAAGARHRGDLGAIDAAGAAKLAEAADRYELSRFILCSVVGAQHPERHDGAIREFLAAKRHAENRLGRLGVPGSILRFGRLTEQPGSGRISTAVGATPLRTSRDDAALAVADTLGRRHLAGRIVTILDGDRPVAEALDAIPPRPLPPPAPVPTGVRVPLGAAQAENPPDDPDMIEHDAPPLDADVDWEGDGPVPPEPVGNEDPAPRIP